MVAEAIRVSLVRHIAGIPTATEQRCVRCCEVIATKRNGALIWPGSIVLPIDNLTGDHVPEFDCTPHDPHLVDVLREILGEALAELERAR